MKKNYHILLFILISTQLLFIDCKRKKEDTVLTNTEVLPNATQEGKNTFGCMLNDEVWLPKNYNPYIAQPSFIYPINISYINKILFIDAYQITKENNKRSIHLYSKNIFSTGQYKLYLENLNKNTTSYSYRESNQTVDNIYPVSDTINSILNITKLDTISKIISGSFSFDFIINNATTKVHNGIFDLKFK